MIILGIDPGYAIVGYGVIEYNASKFRVIDYGAITTQAGTPAAQRLDIIYGALGKLIEKTKPEVMSVEKLYFNTNVTTAIRVAEARGVIMLCAQRHGVSVAEYTPLQVKQAVVGYGKAEKHQVQQMVKMMLNLKEIPKPDDTADALAIAVCHAHSGFSRALGLN
ncbi:MAG: crossover junction endodeoxyribonuclease RuvC [Clostridia bacterium]|nr:crossover junction endodeoxyribonuclease RuvC [Clostridia bacterium]